MEMFCGNKNKDFIRRAFVIAEALFMCLRFFEKSVDICVHILYICIYTDVQLKYTHGVTGGKRVV